MKNYLILTVKENLQTVFPDQIVPIGRLLNWTWSKIILVLSDWIENIHSNYERWSITNYSRKGYTNKLLCISECFRTYLTSIYRSIDNIIIFIAMYSYLIVVAKWQI